MRKKISMMSKTVGLTVIVIGILTACASDKSIQPEDTVYNTETVTEEIKTVLTTGELSDTFITGFSFNEADITTIDDNYNIYYSYGSCYIQTGQHMYRFQFSNSGKIESYIKYNLKA